MRILNAGDKCTQLDLNSKLIGDLFLIINVFSFSLKEQTSFRTEITVSEISSIIIPSTESIWPVAIKNADLAGDWLSF